MPHGPDLQAVDLINSSQDLESRLLAGQTNDSVDVGCTDRGALELE
jgi:hypothetical protein